MAGWLRCRVVADHCVIINGPGSGALIYQRGGTVLYSRRLRGYSSSLRIASEVAILAEREGRRVFWIDERQAKLIDLSPQRDSRVITSQTPQALQLELGGAS